MPRRPPTLALAAIAGASAAGCLLLGERLLGPFAGAGPSLRTLLALVTLAGFASGCVFGGRRFEPPPGLGRVASILLAAGFWWSALPWVRGPLLRGLEPAGARTATVVAALLFFAVPALAAGMMLPASMRGRASPGADPTRVAAAAVAVASLGAMLAVLLFTWILVPHLGASRSSLLLGLVHLAAGAWAFGAENRRPSAAASSLLLVAGVGLLAKVPMARAAPEFGIVRVRAAARGELRVLDRDGGRYLLLDGTILGVADLVTGLPLERSSAALQLVPHLFASPGRALVVGVRAGSVARSLARDGWTVRALEEDPALVEAVQEDFGSAPPAVRIDLTEPRASLRRSDSTYDLIVLDAFGETSPPLPLATREFFELAASRLAPGGVVALAVESRGWEDLLVRSLAATLRTCFSAVVALPTSEPPDRLGSVVLLAANRALEFPEVELPNPKDVLGDDYLHWVVVQMNHAWFNRYEPRADGACVLTDDRSPLDLWSDRINGPSRRELHAFFGPWGHSW